MWWRYLRVHRGTEKSEGTEILFEKTILNGCLLFFLELLSLRWSSSAEGAYRDQSAVRLTRVVSPALAGWARDTPPKEPVGYPTSAHMDSD
jgi:hypothetical protein